MDDFDGFSMPRVFFSNDLLDATIWGTTFLIGFNNIQQLWDGLFLHPYWGKISQDGIFSTSLKPPPSKNQCRFICDLFEQWQWSKSGARKGICRASRCRGLDFLSSVASYCNGASRCLCEKPGGVTRVKGTALGKISCQWWHFSQPQLELIMRVGPWRWCRCLRYQKYYGHHQQNQRQHNHSSHNPSRHQSSKNSIVIRLSGWQGLQWASSPYSFDLHHQYHIKCWKASYGGPGPCFVMCLWYWSNAPRKHGRPFAGLPR